MQRQTIFWFYALSVLFAGANVAFFYWDIPYFSALPALLLVAYTALFALDKIFWLCIFFTPLSINIEEFTGNDLGLFVPTEPMLLTVLLLFTANQVLRPSYDLRILKHPISLIILLQLGWMLITAVTSESPLVSFKYSLVRFWFVIPLYFFAIPLLAHTRNIRQMIWLYMLPLTGVILYTVTNHALHNFEEKPAHWVMWPFYKDHTSYGAILAMYFPAVIGFYFDKKLMPIVRSLLLFIGAVFVAGIILSYTRAAWVSLLGALGFYLVLWFRVKISTLIVTALAGVFLFFSFYDQVMMNLQKNKTDSSGDFAEHMQSVSNISSDASNLERINRWNCALRMWEEKPVFGWGPGTYQFYYAPFQHSSELTIISTNFGNMGNAHSEYLGPLAEQGVPGMALMIVLVVTVIYTGVRLYSRLEAGELRLMVTITLMGLTTYFIHGILNNYLDTDKAAVPFWGFIAVIVAIDLRTRSTSEKTDGEQSRIV